MWSRLRIGDSRSVIEHKTLNEADPSALFSNILSSFLPAPPAMIKLGFGLENLVV